MSHIAEVKGGATDRYRAYGEVKLLRSPSAADHIKRHDAGLAPLELGAKIRYTGEDVLLEGAVSGASLSISTDKQITRVVFYSGPVETETVAGAVEVNATGTIAIDLVAAPDIVAAAEASIERQIVDEI